VDLNLFIADLKDVLERIAGVRSELVTSLGSELGKVWIDPDQLEQILMTLVVNAHDAMPDGGSILLETANVEASRTTAKEHLDIPAGSYVVLRVIDNGRGMDEPTLRHLFEPFFTTKGLGPSGLGLSSVHGIAKQNGGGVAAISQPGRGTTIEVYFPRI
jgi:signal transduction histidine kinase